MFIKKESVLKSKKKIKIYACDFETTIYNDRHYVTCYSIYGDGIKACKSVSSLENFDIVESTELLNSFINILLSLNKCTIIFHNLSKKL